MQYSCKKSVLYFLYGKYSAVQLRKGEGHFVILEQDFFLQEMQALNDLLAYLLTC